MRLQRLCSLAFLVLLSSEASGAQQPVTWQEVRDKFEAANPSLRAGQIGIDESRADEVTANLRPNPNLTVSVDQINPFTTQASPSGSPGNSYQPFAYALPFGSLSYLHERQHKRELRLESAQKATGIAISSKATWSVPWSSI